MATAEGTRLITLLREKVAAFRAACQDIDERAAVCAPEGRWTPKEIVSHLCGPEGGGLLAGLRRFVDEETPRIDLVPEQTFMTPRREELPFAAMLDEMEAEYARIAEFVASLSDDQLGRRAHIPLLKGSSIGGYPTLSLWVQAIADYHIAFHIDHLRDVLAGRKALCFTVNKDRCGSCAECAADCPMGIIECAGAVPSIAPENLGACIACQHCFAVCPHAAISIFGLNPDDSQPLAGHLPEPQQLITLIKGRRSVRRYRPEPVDRATIDMLLQVVANCPTGKNTCRNLYTVIDDPAVMEQFRQRTMAGIRTAVENNTLPAGMEFFSGALRAWDSGKDVIFRGAPHLLAVSTPANGPSPEADTLIALTTFDLLAQSMGLGTLWNGFAKWAVTKVVPEMSRVLGIPGDHYLGYLMSFGKPAVEYWRTVERGPAHINRVSLA